MKTDQSVAAPVRYCWSFEVARPASGRGVLSPQTMTASEQMFFLGAPLAHVVRFEEHAREHHESASRRRLQRGQRGSPVLSPLRELVS